MSIYSSERSPLSVPPLGGYYGTPAGVGRCRCVWADGVSTVKEARNYVYTRILRLLQDTDPDDLLYLHCGNRQGVEFLSESDRCRFLEVGWDTDRLVAVDDGKKIDSGLFSVPLFKRLGSVHSAHSGTRAVVAEEICSRCGDPHDLFLNLSYYCRSGETVIVLDDFRSVGGEGYGTGGESVSAPDGSPKTPNGLSPSPTADVRRRLRRYSKLQETADAAFTHGFRLTDCIDLTPDLQIDGRLRLASIRALFDRRESSRPGDEGIRGPREYRRLLDQGLLRYILVTFTRIG